MKILCVGDSLALPREGVSYEDTWFYKLSTNYPNVHFISKFVRELTTDKLTPRGDYSYFYKPDVVITQFGVVDCAPRIINERLRRWKILLFISNLFGLYSFTWKMIKKRHHRNNPDVVYVNPKDFESNIVQYFTDLRLGGAKLIIVVKIGMPGQSVRKKSPCFADNVNRYNSIFDKVANELQNIVVIDPLIDGDDVNYVDGYHTNGKGFQLVYNKIEKVLFDNEIIREIKK